MALAYATYVLAKNPEIQEKLQAEIDELLSANNDSNDEGTKKYPDHDLVAQMPSMNMFINEVLRMFPIANRAVQRRATADKVVQGIKIDKGNHRIS